MRTLRAQRLAASFAGVGALSVAAATLGLACSSSTKPAAALEVVIATDLRYPTDYDIVEVRVSQVDASGVLGMPLFDTAMSVALPTSVAIKPGSSPSQTARIVVTALKGDKVVVASTAQTQVPTSSVEELDMFLGAACEGVSCSLADTCAAGTCEGFAVDPSQLKPYDPNDLTPDATVSTTPDGGPPSDASMPPGDARADAHAEAEASCSGSACPTPEAGVDAASCGPGNCAGCCDTAQRCQTGTAASACGTGGQACLGCASGATCSGGSCVVPCGSPGQACCPYNQCGQGNCCDQGTCVGSGQNCPAAGGACQGGACDDGLCGHGGVICCAESPKPTCTTPFTVCAGSSCAGCGGSMEPCCPGSVCQAGFVCGQPPDGGAPSCLGCGMSRQLCCDTDAGVAGAPTTACQSGACTQMGQCP